MQEDKAQDTPRRRQLNVSIDPSWFETDRLDKLQIRVRRKFGFKRRISRVKLVEMALALLEVEASR